MSRFERFARTGAILGPLLGALSACTPSKESAPPLLTGSVRSATGQPMPGVTVSAKLAGGPVTISVFTDEQGKYYFPPFPTKGNYSIRAQAAGYDKAESAQALDGGIRHADFTMQPTANYLRQLSGWQQIRGLPEDTRESRRGKALFIRACTGCHQSSKAFTRRFDAKGWGDEIDVMATLTPTGKAPAVFISHREEIATYLAKIAGPDKSPMKLELPPAPSGEVLLSTIYEYDIPNIEGGYPLSSGSDWAEGPPTGTGTGVSIHDATVDLDGNVWYTSPAPIPGRTVGRMDGATGAHTNVAFPGKARPEGSGHAIVTAQDGTLWFNVFYDRALLSYLATIDPRTNQREYFYVPEGMTPVGGWVNEDGNGDIWSAAGTYSGPAGALKFSRKTRTFTEFKSLKGGMTYGAAGDAQGNGWWAQINDDRIYFADATSRKVEEIDVPFSWQGASFLRPGDMSKEEYRDIVFGVGSVRGGAQMPRRLKADLHGDSVWVGNWAGNNLMRIDTRTHKMEFNPAPFEGMLPYDVGIDGLHRVWVGLQNGDEVARFDPDTKRWTIYPLPTKGVSPRSLVVVERAGRIEVVVPANDARKVIRLIPGTAADVEALKKRYAESAG